MSKQYPALLLGGGGGTRPLKVGLLVGKSGERGMMARGGEGPESTPEAIRYCGSSRYRAYLARSKPYNKSIGKEGSKPL